MKQKSFLQLLIYIPKRIADVGEVSLGMYSYREVEPTVSSWLRTTEFWKTFHGNFIYTQSFCQKSAEKQSVAKGTFFHISFCWRCLSLYLNRGHMSDKPTYSLQDYGNFRFIRVVPKNSLQNILNRVEFVKQQLRRNKWGRMLWSENIRLISLV